MRTRMTNAFVFFFLFVCAPVKKEKLFRLFFFVCVGGFELLFFVITFFFFFYRYVDLDFCLLMVHILSSRQ